MDKKYVNTGRYVQTTEGMTAVFHLLPYLCVKCGKLIEGEFSGDYIGEESVKNAQAVTEKRPCFSCARIKRLEIEIDD